MIAAELVEVETETIRPPDFRPETVARMYGQQRMDEDAVSLSLLVLVVVADAGVTAAPTRFMASSSASSGTTASVLRRRIIVCLRVAVSAYTKL